MRAALVLVCAVLTGCLPTGVSSQSASNGVVSDCSPGVHEGTFAGMPVRVQVPKVAGDPGPLPAVVVLHGAGDDGRFVAKQTHFGKLGRAEGFVTVFPSAPNGEWQLNDKGVAQINDLASSLSCVDHRRIYLTGFSRGSAMTFRVACTGPKREFAAFGGVAFPDYMRRCNSVPPAAWIYFHGLKDGTVSYSDGYVRESGRVTPNARTSMRRWARHNGCGARPRITNIGSDVVLRSYSACRDRAAVDFYTITDGDHQWPFRSRPNAPLLGFGQSWASVGATEQMWKFFTSRSLPPKSGS